jgi:MYXO-CTERM domain-containing protein
MVCTSPYGYGYGVGGVRTVDQSGAPVGSSTGGGTSGAAGMGGSVPPMTPSPTHESVGNGTSSSAGGCAVAGGSSSLAFAALALLGLVLARRRR